MRDRWNFAVELLEQGFKPPIRQCASDLLAQGFVEINVFE
jgi:hypothetical protein